MVSKSNDSTTLSCSFCGKKKSEVKKLIAGENGHICDVNEGNASFEIVGKGRLLVLLKRGSASISQALQKKTGSCDTR